MDHITLWTQALGALQAGERGRARRLLYRLVSLEPDHKVAWVVLTTLAPTRSACLACLERALQLDPANRALQNALIALHKAPRAPTAHRSHPGLPSARRWLHQACQAVHSRLSQLRQRVHSHLQTLRAPRPRRRRLAPQPPSPRPRAQRQPSPPAGQTSRLQLGLVGGLAVLVLVTFGVLGLLVVADPNAVSAIGLASLSAAGRQEVPPPTATPRPVRTLRPTFTSTATPTETPSPTLTSSPTPAPTMTDTPAPTSTPTSPPTSTPSRRRPVVPSATPTFTPTPTPLPMHWDARLDALGVRVERAELDPGRPTWRLIEARWADEAEAQGEHLIFIEALNEVGARALGQPVRVRWGSNGLVVTMLDKPPPEYGANFPMYATLGSYAVEVDGAPSDRVVGLGLGTAQYRGLKVHTCFYLTFRRIVP